MAHVSALSQSCSVSIYQSKVYPFWQASEIHETASTGNTRLGVFTAPLIWWQLSCTRKPTGYSFRYHSTRWALAKRVLLKVWFQKGPILSFSSLSVGDHCMLYLLSRKFFWHYLQVFNYNFELWWLFATPAVPLSKMEFRRCMLCLLATPCLNKS